VAGEFVALARKLDKISDAVGPVGLKTALRYVADEARRDVLREGVAAVGSDLKYSGWPRLGTLGAPYKITGTTITLTPKPAGGWIVAEQGRRSTKAPSRASAGGKRLKGERKRDSVNMLTPWGWRSYSKEHPMRIGNTRAKKTLTKATRTIQSHSPARLQTELHRQLTGIFRG